MAEVCAAVTVLSVDLACKDYRSIGVVLLYRQDERIGIEFPALGLLGTPEPEALAARLAQIATEQRVCCMLLDGPQAWKDEDNGLRYARLCEQVLNTPAKTGLPGEVKPRNYRPFVAFSITVFDILEGLGWPRLENPRAPEQRSIESFPTAAWRALGMRALPAKAKTQPAELRQALLDLDRRFPLQLSREPNHDELQAIVAGLGGLALEARDGEGFRAEGVAPFPKAGAVREGFIVVPRRRQSL